MNLLDEIVPLDANIVAHGSLWGRKGFDPVQTTTQCSVIFNSTSNDINIWWILTKNEMSNKTPSHLIQYNDVYNDLPMQKLFAEHVQVWNFLQYLETKLAHWDHWTILEFVH